MRHSEHAGKGNGGWLVQMQQFEQLQMEWSKQQSRIDIITQEEDINLMAPSSQNICEHSSCTGWVSSNEEVASKTQDQVAPASLQPEFMLAAPGQWFSFRVPDAESQLECNTQAPTCTWFPGVYSQSLSKGSVPPLSCSGLLFSNSGRCSTMATSHAPSVCSSLDERHLSRQHNPTSQHAAISSHIDMMDDIASQHEHAFCYDWLSLRNFFSTYLLFLSYAPFRSLSISQGPVCILIRTLMLFLRALSVTIDYLSGTSFLLIRTTQLMLPLGLCQYLEDRYVFSLGPRCFSFAPFPWDAPTTVPLLIFASWVG